MPTRVHHYRLPALSWWSRCWAPLGAVADGDPNDERHLAGLRSQGIAYASPEVAIAAGHAACTELDNGETPTQVAQDVMTSSNLDTFHAGYFVGASIGAYCPKYASQI